MATSKIIMGIDPGLTRCGVGVITQKSAKELSLKDVGVILTPMDAPLEQRLLQLEIEIEAWIERNKPDVIAVERVFAQHNVRTVMGTGQAAGVALLIAARRVVYLWHFTLPLKSKLRSPARVELAKFKLPRW